MTKKNITREEIADQLISDQFFEKEHLGLTLRQGFVAALAWLGVFLPFLWLMLPFFFPQAAEQLHFRTYLEGFITFDFLSFFLLVAFLCIAVVYIGLTLRNNHRFKHQLCKEPLHDPEMLAIRKRSVEAFYTKRFGSKAERESIRFYSVKEEQNLEIDSIQQLFHDEGASL